MAEEKPIGAILDGLGVTADFEDSDLIESAIVILRYVDAEGVAWSHTTWSPGLDVFSRLGLLDASIFRQRLNIGDKDEAED